MYYIHWNEVRFFFFFFFVISGIHSGDQALWWSTYLNIHFSLLPVTLVCNLNVIHVTPVTVLVTWIVLLFTLCLAVQDVLPTERQSHVLILGLPVNSDDRVFWSCHQGLFQQYGRKESDIVESGHHFSLETLQLGQLIGKGCNAAVYEARSAAKCFGV